MQTFPLPHGQEPGDSDPRDGGRYRRIGLLISAERVDRCPCAVVLEEPPGAARLGPSSSSLDTQQDGSPSTLDQLPSRSTTTISSPASSVRIVAEASEALEWQPTGAVMTVSWGSAVAPAELATATINENTPTHAQRGVSARRAACIISS